VPRPDSTTGRATDSRLLRPALTTDIPCSDAALARRVGTKETLMQMRKRFSLLAVPMMMCAAHGLAYAADGTPAREPEPSSMPTPAMPALSSTPTPTQATPTASRDDAFGVAMTADQLDAHRGGDALIGQNDLTGRVANNTANRVETGSNSISQGSFANASGLPTVIQNSGANVLIQNATVLNVRFGN
jgi:hypothetical protein